MPDEMPEQWPAPETDEQRKTRERRTRLRRFWLLVGRIAAIAVTVTVVLLALGGTVWRPSPVLSGTAPLMLAGGLWLVVVLGYPVVRQLKWPRRQRAEREAEKALAIPADALRPKLYPEVEIIDRAQHLLLPEAPDHQGKMYRRGVSVAVLPALAVLLGALQHLRDDDAPWTTGATVAEIGVLALLVAVVRSSPKPAAPWVDRRTRAELLRREQYLRLAGIGPYLGKLPDAAADLTKARILDIARRKDPESAVAMSDGPNGPRWIDQFWQRPNADPFPDLRQRARTYLYYRIDRQRMWFKLGSDETNRTEKRISNAIASALLGASVLGLVQIVLRLFEHDVVRLPEDFATLFTLVLPPFAAFLIAVRELYTVRTRSASYSRMLKHLGGARGALSGLVTSIETHADDESTLTRQFQASVLHLETALSVELQTWIMITERDQFELEL